MKRWRFLLTALLALGGMRPAQAFLGVGDISFDPSSYGELVSIYSELQQAYSTLNHELAALQDIKDMTSRAQQTINSVRNKDYVALATSLVPSTAIDGLAATRSRIETLLAKDPGNSASYGIELDQLSAMAQLRQLQSAAGHNLQRSALDLGPRDSSQVTAQSTAALAALAAAEAQRQSAQAAASAQADIDARSLVTGAGAIYRTLGAQ